MPTPLQLLNQRRLRNRSKQQQQQQQQPQQPQQQTSVRRDSILHQNTPNTQTPVEQNSTHLSSSHNEESNTNNLWSSSLYQTVNISKSQPTADSSQTTKFFGETRLYFHSSTSSNSILCLNSSFFPGIEKGDIIYILTEKSDKLPIFLEVDEPPSAQNSVSISIQEKLGQSLKLIPQQLVQIGSCSRDKTALKLVEVTIVDGCLPRQEMWSLLHSLQNQFVYVNKRLKFAEYEVEISNLSLDGVHVSCGGLIVPSTDILFYRNNCRMYIVFHITREVLVVDPSGYLRGEIMTDFCLKKIQELWKQGNTHHLVTVVISCDLIRDHIEAYPINFVKVLCRDNENDLEDVKNEIKKFISSIRADFTIPFKCSNGDFYENDTFRLRHSENSSPLTILNTILKDVKYNKQTSQFTVNGSHIIVITPSVPIYLIDKDYYNLTQNNFHEAAVGVDLVSVAPISPFEAPLFRFTNANPVQQIVSGFIPAIFYSVTKDVFLQSVKLKNEKQATYFQERIRGYYTQCDLIKPCFKDLPIILPQLPYVSRASHVNETIILDGIMSYDENEENQGDYPTDNGPDSMDHTNYHQYNSLSLPNSSSIDSNSEAIDRFQHDSYENGLGGNSGSFKEHTIWKTNSTSSAHSTIPTVSSIFSFTNYKEHMVPDSTDYYVQENILHNDDILFWQGRNYDNRYVSHFIRSLVRPAIFPLLLPGHLNIPSDGTENKSLYSIISLSKREQLLNDFIRIRLAFNFQFIGYIPALKSLDRVVMTLRRKEKHTLSRFGNQSVNISTQLRGPRSGSYKVTVYFQYPYSSTIHCKSLDINQVNIDWNKIDNGLDISRIHADTIKTMRQYNRLHFTIVEQSNKTCRVSHFFTLLKQLYPIMSTISIKTDIKELSLLRALIINTEPVFFVYDDGYSLPLHFHFDLYWAVASLSSVRKVIDDVKKIAIRCNLICIHYPDEVHLSLKKPLSPLIYTYDINLTKISMDYYNHLISNQLYYITSCNNRFKGYTDITMKQFAQLDLCDNIIRVCEVKTNANESNLITILEDDVVICAVMDYLIQQIVENV